MIMASRDTLEQARIGATPMTTTRQQNARQDKRLVRLCQRIAGGNLSVSDFLGAVGRLSQFKTPGRNVIG